MTKPQRAFALPAIALLAVYSLAPTSALAVNTVSFNVAAAGTTKSVADWGVDTAWPNFDNVRQTIASIGVNNVDTVRVTFSPGQPLVANGDGTYSLNVTAKASIDNQLALAALAGSKPLTFVPGELPSTFDATNWVRTIKATQEYINSRSGFTTTPVKSIEAFNEPDYWSGEGTPSQLNSVISQLKAYSVFQTTAFPVGSTLNSDNAAAWYDPVPAATQGSSHLLGGSLTSWVNFLEHVKSTGKTFVNPELHSLGEAIVGADHGMVAGTFWADVLRARGLFVQASDGKRLAYYEDLGRQSAAAVYRAPNGKIYAFAGGLERFGSATSYRFVNTDQDVFFNGIPVREFMLQTKFDENASSTDNDFQNYGSWSSQGAYADIEATSSLPALDGYRWKIVNPSTGNVMEVLNGSTFDGGTIRSAPNTGNLNQMWNIVRTRNGYYHLFNANSGRTAEVANFSLNNGATVRQYGTADNQAQQWYIEDAGDGSFYIRNAFSNKYLTGSTLSSTQSDLTSSALQKWQFVSANPTSGPITRYNFQGNASDSVGTNHGISFGNPVYGQGPFPSTAAIQFDGVNDYVQLPSSVATSADITISASVKWDGGNSWQRIFDFGNDTNSYMFLTPKSGDNTMRFAITKGGNNSEQILETSALPIGQWTQLTLTLGGNTGILYVNGKPQVAGQILLNSSDIAPTLNYIGKSQFSADSLFKGAIANFQIFNYALNGTQVSNLYYNNGDFNHDGSVDAADFVAWRENPTAYGDSAGYNLWRQNFGSTVSGSGSLAAFDVIPEPSTELSIAIGAIAWAANRKKRVRPIPRK